MKAAPVPQGTVAAEPLVTVAFSVAQAFGPQVGGVLIDHSGGAFTTTFVTVAVVLAASALFSVQLWRAPHPAPPSRP